MRPNGKEEKDRNRACLDRVSSKENEVSTSHYLK